MAETTALGPNEPTILVATLLRGTGSTGVETHAVETIAELTRTGARAQLVTSFSGSRALTVLWFGPRIVLDKVAPSLGVIWHRWSHGAALRRALSRRLRHEPVAVVYAQCPVSARAALRARRDESQRVVLAVHFNVSQADEWAGKGKIPTSGRTFRAIRRLEQDVLTSVDALVYVSRAAQAEVAAHVLGVERIPSVIIPNFTRDGATGRDPSLPAPAELVTVGALEPRKNHAFLLDVLAETARQGRRCSLDIVGEGSSHQELARRAAQLGLTPDVHFLGNRTDVRALLPGHRLYVHAAHHESFGISLIEAMSAGLPVLAPPVGGIPEVLDGGRAGAFWSLDNPVEAAGILLRLLDDHNALARAGHEARARFLATYSAEQVVPRLARFLATAAHGSSTEDAYQA